LNDNQISVAQSEPDDLACLLHLRGKRLRKNNHEHEKKKACNQSTSAKKTTSIRVTTSIWQQAGRQHRDLPIGFALNSLERSLSQKCTSCHGTLSTKRNLAANWPGFCAAGHSFSSLKRAESSNSSGLQCSQMRRGRAE
jgi:hypothetical protein